MPNLRGKRNEERKETARLVAEKILMMLRDGKLVKKPADRAENEVLPAN